MESRTVTIETGHEFAHVDLTGHVEAFLADVGAGDGLVNVFLPHATAGVAIMELEPGTRADTPRVLGDLLPRDGRWAHDHGSPGHGADHVLPLLVAPSVSIPVLGGRLQLGTWQSVVLVDPNVDNPTRTVRVSFLSG
ncbi:secondary thiamine-phosphate synthase enzyme YjbQ [Euzebya sp.]|uniref:secondary thiamine-phosphate synthase enzyme YjbQ n=1 Tax=Euzebya sp. TaxID=1971409 RepID=UPI003513ECA4